MAGCRAMLHKTGSLAVIAAVMLVVASNASASARAHRLRWPSVYRVLHRSVRASGPPSIFRNLARSPRARASIVGGSQVAITQAPWQVFVLTLIPLNEEEGLALLCGGSVIDETHIVTAAHCMFDPETGSKVPPEDVSVVAGTSDFRQSEAGEQDAEVAAVRVHPYFEHAVGAGAPDDVAVLDLTNPLTFGGVVQPIGLPAPGAVPGEGAQVNLTGFGQEIPTANPEGPLRSIGMTIGYSRSCGGSADALFLCASTPAGSGCHGDSGSGLTEGSPPTLVGIMDTVEIVSAESCRSGSDNGFVNVAAPEIQDFIEGSETPPLAPRGGGAAIRAVTEAGHVMTCEPGSWSGSPTYAYAFVDSANQQILQSGQSSTYQLATADVGRTIYCQVSATNAGGTGLGRTPALSAIRAAPLLPATSWNTPPEQISPTLLFSTLSLADADLATAANGSVTIKLECEGEQACAGRLTLKARQLVKKKHGKRASHTVTIGHFDFSIPAGQTTDVKLRLNGIGLVLLKAAHGKLFAKLQIAQASKDETETTEVHLIESARRTSGRHRHMSS
ncbi:MAG TPA: serine protease [Solirubrobacteraceae bacterium]|jgi:hypothetical protein|nr:serine protease [Solirubrobacteraceae bacterium]